MKKYSNEQLQKNYDLFLTIIKKYFKGERLERLLHMYSMDELGPNLMLSPASSIKHFHNAYEGGYIDHIFNVCKNALKMKELFISAGGTIDFTDEELIFSAMHHDLGKLGTKGNLHYIANDSEWHVKNKGEVYRTSTDEQYMLISDKTFYNLQYYGVKYSPIEMLTMKLTDGLYEELNKDYLKVFDPQKQLRYTLPRIMHWADHMSSVIEKQNGDK